MGRCIRLSIPGLGVKGVSVPEPTQLETLKHKLQDSSTFVPGFSARSAVIKLLLLNIFPRCKAKMHHHMTVTHI